MNMENETERTPSPEIKEAPYVMTTCEDRLYLFTATRTAQGFGLVMSAVMVLFVLFCIHVWL
jgi:hypothetical protein